MAKILKRRIRQKRLKREIDSLDEEDAAFLFAFMELLVDAFEGGVLTDEDLNTKVGDLKVGKLKKILEPKEGDDI